MTNEVAPAAPKEVYGIFAITGIVDCCACAATGHATAAPPISVMNSRRLIAAPWAKDRQSYG